MRGLSDVTADGGALGCHLALLHDWHLSTSTARPWLCGVNQLREQCARVLEPGPVVVIAVRLHKIASMEITAGVGPA
jgi:hypothetical protein